MKNFEVICKLVKLSEIVESLETIKTPIYLQKDCPLEESELKLDHGRVALLLTDEGNINWHCPLCGERFML